jgi:hypothetical protein
MKKYRFVMIVLILALLPGCGGPQKNYRTGTGVVQGETRALDGISK